MKIVGIDRPLIYQHDAHPKLFLEHEPELQLDECPAKALEAKVDTSLLT
jgi:hypothetical protein